MSAGFDIQECIREKGEVTVGKPDQERVSMVVFGLVFDYRSILSSSNCFPKGEQALFSLQGRYLPKEW